MAWLLYFCIAMTQVGRITAVVVKDAYLSYHATINTEELLHKATPSPLRKFRHFPKSTSGPWQSHYTLRITLHDDMSAILKWHEATLLLFRDISIRKDNRADMLATVSKINVSLWWSRLKCCGEGVGLDQSRALKWTLKPKFGLRIGNGQVKR